MLLSTAQKVLNIRSVFKTRSIENQAKLFRAFQSHVSPFYATITSSVVLA